jgi:hypothetical protein
MCDTEVYTVRVDSYGASSNASFTGYLNIPLKNVIRAELLSASLGANATVLSNLAYIHVQELVSKFNTRAELKYEQRAYSNGAANTIVSDVGSSFLTMSNTFQLATALVGFPVPPGIPDQRVSFSSAGNFPVEVEFMEPIRYVDKLTVNVLREDGGQPTLQNGSTFLTLRMTCSKPNVCLYP